jgi:multiple sugar transport system ATP-binding protein
VVNIGKQDSILVLGIRPEWVHISRKAKDGFREAEVFIVEPQGRYNIVDVKVGNAVIKAKTETALRLTVGERIWINLHEESIHLFDKDTGIAI